MSDTPRTDAKEKEYKARMPEHRALGELFDLARELECKLTAVQQEADRLHVAYVDLQIVRLPEDELRAICAELRALVEKAGAVLTAPAPVEKTPPVSDSVKSTADLTPAQDDLAKMLKRVLNLRSTIERLGEWSSLGTNRGLYKKALDHVDAIEKEARALLAKEAR